MLPSIPRPLCGGVVDFFLDDLVSVLKVLPRHTTKVLFDQDGIAEMLNVEDPLCVTRDWREVFAMMNQPVTVAGSEYAGGGIHPEKFRLP